MAYTAVVLDEVSRSRVIEITRSAVGIPGDWQLKGHHMTIETKNIAKTAVAERAGEIVEMTVTHIGVGTGIVAVQVRCDAVPSKNSRKHVTIAHMTGVKPVESNNIPDENWRALEVFTICGRIEEVA
jgi:hypothetical protein